MQWLKCVIFRDRGFSGNLPRDRIAQSSISTTYQNVRRLNTKLKYFRQSVLATDSDIVAVTESWMSEPVEMFFNILFVKYFRYFLLIMLIQEYF